MSIHLTSMKKNYQNIQPHSSSNSPSMSSSKSQINLSPLKTSSTSDLICYITELEKKIDKKCIDYNSKMKEISSQVNQMTYSFSQQKINVEKISELEHSVSKLSNKITTHEIRINQISKEVSDFCVKYDKIFKENFNFPGLIGPFCKYKAISDFFNYVNEQITTLILFKDKTILDSDVHQKKTDSMFQNLNFKMENFTKNQINACNKIFNDAKNKVFDNIEDANQKFFDLHAEIINKTNTLRSEILKLVDQKEKMLTNIIIELKHNENETNSNDTIVKNGNSSNIILVNNNTSNINHSEDLLEEINNLKEQILAIKNNLDERNSSNNKRQRNNSEKSINHITNLSSLKNTKTKIMLSNSNSNSNLPINNKSRNTNDTPKHFKSSSTLSTEEISKLNSSYLKKKLKKNLSSSLSISQNNSSHFNDKKQKQTEIPVEDQSPNKNLDIKEITTKKTEQDYEQIKCFTELQEGYKTKSLMSLIQKDKKSNDDINNDSSNIKSDGSSTSNNNNNNIQTKKNKKINPIQVMQFANKDNIELLRFVNKKNSSKALKTLKNIEGPSREERSSFGTVKVSKVLTNSISIRSRNSSKEKIPPIDCSPINTIPKKI